MPIIAIVDAYGPGMYFVHLLKEKGYSIIHIQSMPEVPAPFRSFIEGAGFIENIVCNNEVGAVINALNKYKNIEAIIPGFETGVLLADALSESLDIKTNGTALSLSRRNKHAMAETLRKNGLPSVNSITTREITEALDWVKDVTHYPVVVKPVDSASSEDVYMCNSDGDIETAFNKILNKKNMLGSDNDCVLIQNYLQGTEYVVNTVSCEGRHFISDLWVCKKRIVNNRFVYDREDLLEFHGEVQATLIHYISKVLDALGIKYGPAHSEVMLTSDGPVLLETGARIGGAVNPPIHQACIGQSQIDLTIDAYTDRDKFYERVSRPYHIIKHLCVVMTISENEGLIKNITLEDDARKLSSTAFIRLKKKVGDTLYKTTDLNTSPGTIYLASVSKDLLESDYQSLLNMVKTGFELAAV